MVGMAPFAEGSPAKFSKARRKSTQMNLSAMRGYDQTRNQTDAGTSRIVQQKML
jgi:hypothetical protein